jgi:hypothetical protein
MVYAIGFARLYCNNEPKGVGENDRDKKAHGIIL